MAPRITITTTKKSNARLWVEGITTKVGYLLVLGLVLFLVLNALAWAEGFEWAEFSPLGALFLAVAIDVFATPFKD